MSATAERKPVRLLTEEEAAAVLRRGGSSHATARTLRWLMQRPGAPARTDFQIDLAAVADFLRQTAGRNAPGLKGAAALFDRIVPERARPRALTYAERQARSRARSSHGDIAADLDAAIEGIDWPRRRRAERDFLYFLRTYCTSDDPADGAFLEIPPAKGMQPIIRDMEQAIGDASIPYHIRVARGHGKTAYTKGAALWVAATGRRRYEIAVGSNDANASGIIEDIFTAATTVPAFVRDFPEIAVPFRKLQGAYQRAKTQKYHGRLTNPRKAADRIVFPSVDNPATGRPFPSSGVILEAVGFNAGARGKVKGILRPDFLIFDDLQNDDKAQSEGQVAKMAAKVKKTFMGLAGHRKKIAAIMTSTPIEADDLSETFAADPGWKTQTYRMVLAWPDCHNPEATAEERKGVRDLWAEYWDIFQAEKAADRLPHIAANRFYRKHRKAMDEGAEVLNPQNFDPNTELSGIQHAMNILLRDGEATFMAEYQMEPVRNAFAVEVTARLIMGRVRPGVPACSVPDGAVLTVAATDVNPAYGLTTAVVAFDVNLTGLVTAYKVFRVKIDGRQNDVAFNAAVTRSLHAHAKEVAALGVRLDRWGIDAGGRQFKAVTAFTPLVKDLHGLDAVAMLGRAGQNWNPFVRSRTRDALNGTVPCRDAQGRRWIAFNADLFKEKAQLAWNTELGGDGGLSLYDGGANHAAFATQVANERLVSKARLRKQRGDGEEQYAYTWKTKNPHDYGDCMAMCYALAAANNLTGDGAPVRSGKHRRKVYDGA